MKRILLLLAFALVSVSACAEITIIDGRRWECKDGMCMPLDDDDVNPETSTTVVQTPPQTLPEPTRMAQGYMEAPEFIAFLKGEAAKESPLAGKGIWLVLLLAFLGGLAMNLTPCVLPMIPINLMIIGKSAARGAWYGLGIAVAYGAMGLLSAVGGMAFGEIQANPWFNLGVAVVFVLLGLSLCGVFFIDFSKRRSKFRGGSFFMGMLSAVLAGACVAPILIAVLLLTAKMFAEGAWYALALPFVLGIGMGLPWPFIGAGLQILPKPGAWMAKVNKLFALLVFAFAIWYGYLAFNGFRAKFVTTDSALSQDGLVSAVPETLAEKLATAKRPVLVDCWATWCKNCTAMELKTFKDPSVANELKRFTIIRLQAEDIKALKSLPGYGEVRGLPTFTIYENTPLRSGRQL